MIAKIDISSLDSETKTKLDNYVKLAQELVEGVPVDITIRLTKQPIFKWDEGDTGFVTPNSIDCQYNLDWEDLEKQEKTIKDKYNALIKEICDFSDNIADSLKVDRHEFFGSFFL